MSNLDRHNIYQQAIERWGVDAQVDQLIEELAELIVAVNHARRSGYVAQDYDHVIEELADVEIMLEQMRYVFESDKIDQVKTSKVLRLRDRLRKV